LRKQLTRSDSVKVYLVEDVGNSPGRIYAVFADEDAAEDYSQHVAARENTYTKVQERNLYYGQQLPLRDGVLP